MNTPRFAGLSLLLSALSTTLIATATAQSACQYNDRAYSSGASVCECPTFSAKKVGKHYREGRITSRRLVCKDATWQQTTGLCYDLQLGNSNDFSQAMTNLSQDLCPPAVGTASSY